MREPGYYWVKLKGEWTIARWASSGGISLWILSGYDFEDSYFEEIDENKIVRVQTKGTHQIFDHLGYPIIVGNSAT
jgi:hypothetical protein